MALNSTQINNAYLGSSNVSAIYLGATLIWPTITRILWRDFNPNSCVSLDITSSAAIVDGLNWKNNDYSNILSGLNQYNYCYGSGSGSAPILNNGILAYWRLDNNGSGSVSLIDSSNNGRTLSVPNGTSNLLLSAGKINGSASFSGSGYLNTSIPNLGVGDFSVSIWVSPSSTQSTLYPAAITLNAAANTSLYVNDSFAPNGLRWNTSSFNNCVPQNAWSHIVLSRLSGNVSIYVNTLLVGTIANDTQQVGFELDLGNANNTYINSTWYKGLIDEVGIWNRVLTLNEISALYNSGNGLGYPF